jgi:hypothetical protein
MEGSEFIPNYIDVSFNTLTEHWHENWLIPRSHRVDDWFGWNREEIRKILSIGQG